MTKIRTFPLEEANHPIRSSEAATLLGSENDSTKESKTLYHFTSHWHLGWILKDQRIWVGDVPTSNWDGFNAPWFTRDSRPTAQGWATHMKTRVRLTVEFPEADEKLILWRLLAKRHHISNKTRKLLNATGGGGAANWYVYLGGVPANWISELTVFEIAPEGAIFRVKKETITPDRLRTLAESFPATPPSQFHTGALHAVPGFKPRRMMFRPMAEIMDRMANPEYRSCYGFAELNQTQEVLCG
jgi:hypothetical protein